MPFRFRRPLLLVCAVLTLTACSTRETKQALRKAGEMESQHQTAEANNVLVAALRAREAQIRAKVPSDITPLELNKKVQADSEILRLERAQIPLYLRLERADLASAVYADILAGHPRDRVLYDLLHDKQPLIRTGAVRTLGLNGNPEALDAMAEAAKDTSEDVRRAAVAALGTINDPRTVPILIHSLNDSYWFARSEAADGLGRKKDARAIKPLLEAVTDPDSNVESAAENALVALCTLPGVSAEEFAPHLNDASPKRVIISAVCLALRKDPQATPVLIKLANSTDVATRLHAVKALGETDDAAAIPTLRQTLNDSEVNVRGWSIIGLQKLKDEGSLPALRALAADSKQTPLIQKFAAEAVKRLTATPATPDAPAATAPAKPAPAK